MSVLQAEVSRRAFLKILTSGAASMFLPLPIAGAIGAMPGEWNGTVIQERFFTGPGYIAASFVTPSRVPRFAALDLKWWGYWPADFGCWVDRVSEDRQVVTKALPVRSGIFEREYREWGLSRLGTFPLEPDAEYWLGIAFMSPVLEIQHVQEVQVTPLKGEVRWLTTR